MTVTWTIISNKALDQKQGDLGALVVFFAAGMLIAAGLAVRRHKFFPRSSPIFSFTGFFVYITVLLILSLYQRGKGAWSLQLDQFPEKLSICEPPLSIRATCSGAITCV